MLSHSPVKRFASAADLAACRTLLRSGSRTFFAASRVLPGVVRSAATGLYAFCRIADDAIDLGVDRVAVLLELRGRLGRIYSGTPDEIPADRALADVVSRYAIPRAFPEGLLEGFAWDAENRRYESFEELLAYAVRVAGVVGAMVALLMGVRDARSIARACDLGVAMQLTNIARDVGEDARNGRLYLPLQWLRDGGIEPEEWLATQRFDRRLAGVIERLLRQADAFYARSEAGLAVLPMACRPGMYAARLLYAEIGAEVRRRRLDSVSQRAVVPWQRKARLLARAVLASATHSPVNSDLEALPQAAFLLASLGADAAANGIAPRRRFRLRPRLAVAERVVWVVDLFDRLERRDRVARALGQVS